MHYPDLETFAKLAESARLVPVYRRLVADCLTPVSAFHKLDKGPCACLFESVIGGEKVGRYSFLTADPFLQVEAPRLAGHDHHAPGDRRLRIGRPAGRIETARR